jgi:hypothetical protein
MVLTVATVDLMAADDALMAAVGADLQQLRGALIGPADNDSSGT